MATLILSRPGSSNDPLPFARPLAEWLNDDWALLFSNPEDFRNDGVEADRWLAILRDAFIERGVRPVALSRGGLQRDRSWISQVLTDHAFVTLSTQSGNALLLRAKLLAEPDRFVAIIDPRLESRLMLRYSRAAGENLSPLDLLATVESLRRRTEPAYEWQSPRRSFIPC